MLTITIPGTEYWDELSEEFIYSEDQVLELEHSLDSISKWESEYHKPFFSKEAKTSEETIFYIKCMTITPNVDPSVYNRLTRECINKVNQYIEDSRSATWFREDKNKKKGPTRNKQVTSELIYYWMTAFNIPPEYQYWHLNRLITLIRVCEAESNPPDKRSNRDIMRSNAARNAATRARLGSKG